MPAPSPELQSQLNRETARRRTFAIISHPDAGKTTLTEKLLLYGGAIHLAGAIKAKKNQKYTTSDWMELEKQRGISISTTVLQFEYAGFQINLLDTPGHQDFSEDTYRTLMAADAAVMLIDAAKGVEPQTIKLFEVCKMRGIPIFTFINKVDRPSLEPLDLLQEIERVLGIRLCPVTWPLGSGDRFRGVYDREKKEFLTFQTEGEANVKGRLEARSISDVSELKKEVDEGRLDEDVFHQFLSEVELVSVAGEKLDHKEVLAGKLSPVFFGSALNNFGVERFLQHFLELAPPPLARHIGDREVLPTDPHFSGFIFKIQANMDPKHRDRVSFLRICSGKMERNMLTTHARLDKDFKIAMPLQFFAQERVVIDEAWPGDIVGLLDTSGNLRIGDTLCEGKPFEYDRVPSFSPEHFAVVGIKNPMKRKQLKKGLEQLDEEGVIQLYHVKDLGDKDPIIGAVGALQFDVLKFRLEFEYGVEVKMDRLPFAIARWISGTGATATVLADFARREDSRVVYDRDENPLVLFRSEWALTWAKNNTAGATFLNTPPLKSASK